MAKIDKVTPVEFIETTTEKLSDVQGVHPGAFIHVNDDNGDDTLYIGDDLVTDKFNIGKEKTNVRTRALGGLPEKTIGQLQEMSLSEILIKILRLGAPADEISITNTPGKHLKDGETVTLNIEVGEDVVDTYVWESSDPTKATVENGVVTAHSITGSVTITVSAEVGEGQDSYEIVIDPTLVTGVLLNKTSITLTSPNATQTLTATVSPSNATNKSVTWSSSDTNVATVNSSGKVTAKDVGTTTITVTTNDGGKPATCSVTVKATYKKLAGGTNPSVGISYIGESEITDNVIIIGSDESLPSVSDFQYNIIPGTWSDGSQFDGTVTQNEFTITQVSEGVYTVSGSVKFGDSSVPVDNFGHEHQEEQYHNDEPIPVSNPITIKVFEPIYINGYITKPEEDGGDDGEDITVMRRYVLDYNNPQELYITIPAETRENKMLVKVPYEFTNFNILQWDDWIGDYLLNIQMEFVDGDEPYYRRVKVYTNSEPTKYKITL